MKTLIAKYNTIDAHNHVGLSDGILDKNDALLRLKAADALGIEKLCVSRPMNAPSPTPSEFQVYNNAVLEAMRLSNRFIGFCFLNPGYGRESLEEIDRCVVKGGMAGIKLYHQYLICDPAMRPVAERATELGIPILMHAGKVMDKRTISSQPSLSNAAHFIQAAKMFPETIFIQGHIGGGGDWEWNLRVLREHPHPNIYIDTSGSNIDADIVKKTVLALGEDRVLFATDGIYEEGVGKVLDAQLTERQLKKIMHDNCENIFSKRRIK